MFIEQQKAEQISQHLIAAADSINSLLSALKESREENKRQTVDIIILQTSCFVKTSGSICMFCVMRETCRYGRPLQC